MRPVRAAWGGALVVMALGYVAACARGSDFTDFDPTVPGAEAGAPHDSAVIPPDDHVDDAGVPQNDAKAHDPTESTCTPTGCAHKVLINEVKTGGPNADDEFVELYNPNACDVSLGKWRIAYQSVNGNSGGAGITFAAGESIGPGAFLLVEPPALKTGLSANSGQLGLLDDNDVVVDAVAYGAVSDGDYQEGPNAPSPPEGSSVGRKLDCTDTDDNASDFEVFDVPTPGVAN